MCIVYADIGRSLSIGSSPDSYIRIFLIGGLRLPDSWKSLRFGSLHNAHVMAGHLDRWRFLVNSLAALLHSITRWR